MARNAPSGPSTQPQNTGQRHRDIGGIADDLGWMSVWTMKLTTARAMTASING